MQAQADPRAINVEDLSGCRHPSQPDHCDDSCACWCDACQERYEAAWAVQTAAQELCDGCGTPKVIRNIEELVRTERYHFFMPCEDCKGGVEAFLQAEGICAMCRGLAKEFCPKCGQQEQASTQAQAQAPETTK